MALWLVCTPFIWDWRCSLSTHFASCAFFASVRTQTRRKIRIRWTLAALSPTPVPVFLFLCSFFLSPPPPPLDRVVYFSIRRRDNEVLIANGYRHERRPNRPQPMCGCFFFSFYFPIYINIYIYVFLFFHLPLVYTGAFAVFTVSVAPLTATCWQRQRMRTRQNFPDTLRVRLIISAFLNFKNY